MPLPKSSLKILRLDDLKSAKAAWLKLSPDKSIYDNWDFRHCFYQDENYPLYFYAGFVQDKMVGLLPLQCNTENKCLEFFGGIYMEDNRVFIKSGYENFIPDFYQAIQQPARLEDITIPDYFAQSFELMEYKYVIDLSEITSLEDYLKKYFRRKRRANLLKIRQIVEAKQPTIIQNIKKDLDDLIRLNKESFGADSSFHDASLEKTFHDLIKMNFDFYLFTIIIKGKKESVSWAVKYKDVYTYINSGTNKKDHPNLGSYISLKNIEQAITLGAKQFDAGVEDLGWKEKWHLDKIPQYKFYKN